jgi:transposase
MATIASQEKRELAIAAYEAGQGSQAHIAAMFGIHLATFKRWLAQKRKDGRTAPLPRGHQKPSFEGPLLKSLDQHVEQNADTSLHELQEIFSDRVSCSHVTVHNTLKRLGWVRKKSGYVRTSEIDRT